MTILLLLYIFHGCICATLFYHYCAIHLLRFYSSSSHGYFAIHLSPVSWVFQACRVSPIVEAVSERKCHAIEVCYFWMSQSLSMHTFQSAEVLTLDELWVSSYHRFLKQTHSDCFIAFSQAEENVLEKWNQSSYYRNASVSTRKRHDQVSKICTGN